MDFSYNEEQQAVIDLATQILEGQSTHDRLKEVEAGDERFDRRTWDELAKAGLLGIALPEDAGGAGLGLLEACLVLEQIGRTTALVPYLPTVVLGALPIAEFGTSEQQKRFLPAVVSGEMVLTAALTEFGTDPRHPFTSARSEGDGWVLEGSKLTVPAAQHAGAILVPARVDRALNDTENVAVFVLEAGTPGLTVEPVETTSGQPEGNLELSGVRVGGDALLGSVEQGAAVLDWIVDRATVALCCVAVGVCEQAVRMTAEYTKTREQFGKPIATFQAVGQRAADAYIDTEGVRLTAWQAAWRLSTGLPSAQEVAVAKFWASEGGQRVVHAAQHLHGGMGVDRDYPLHRYFLWAKQIELSLGGTTPQLLRLGAMLASEPV